MIGLKDAIKALGINLNEIDEAFEADIYAHRSIGGDLGDKHYPLIVQNEHIYKGVYYNSSLTYDSALPNIGRVLVTENKNAYLNKVCMIFGASSSYTMLNYANRVFSKIYFIHFAASCDPHLVKKLRPDYLICQTNERFCIRAPSMNYRLSQKVKEKWQALSPEERVAIAIQQEKWMKGQKSEEIAWFQNQIPEVDLDV